MLDRKFSFSLRSIFKWWLFPPICAATIMLLVFATVYAKWTTSAVAAWVQAFGSIAAILAAIWIAGAQARREQAEALTRQRLMSVIILDVARRAKKQTNVMSDFFGQRNNPFASIANASETRSAAIEGITLELKGFDLTTVGTPEIATAILELIGACEELLNELRIHRNVFSVVSPWMQNHIQLRAITWAANRLEEACEAACEK